MIKLATVFSGIGAIEHALQRMNIKHKIVFACDNGDVNILSQPIELNVEAIEKEVISLENIISKIKCKTQDDIELVYELRKDLSKIINSFAIEKVNLKQIQPAKLTQKANDIFIRIISQNTVKAIRKKEYSNFCIQISNAGSSEAAVLIAIHSLINLINDFSKDNDIKYLIETNTVKFKSSDNIEWAPVVNELSDIHKAMESIEAKKLLKRIKGLCEMLSMLHERINSTYIIKDLNELKTYKEKKEYVDKLYAGKESQNKVKQSYMANFKISEDDFHWNISFLDGTQYKDQVDLFVGGSPCQSFSLVGKQRGLEDTRGTLFYEYARLVQEIRPKVFIYENVKAVLSNDNGRTWETMQQVFTDLDYTWYQNVLNAKDYGIPQNRERIFVVGFRNDLKLKNKFSFPVPFELDKKMQDFLLDNVSGKYYLPKKGVDFVTNKKNLTKRYTQIDGDIQLCQKKNQQFNWHGDFVFVEENTNMEKTMQNLEKYFLSEKVKKYVLSTGTKGFYSNPQTDLIIARPLLTTMHKMHRAGVDNYVTTDGRLRKLTPRECLRLMGFCDSFKIIVSDTSMYQQAGNSIVVNVLMHILYEISKCYNFESQEECI